MIGRQWLGHRLILLVMIILVLPLTGCARNVAEEDQQWTQKVSDRLMEQGKIPKVGVILSGRDTFMNQLVTNALKGSSDSQQIELRTILPNEIPFTQDAVKFLAENNYSMIIGLTPDYAQVVNQIQKNYPETTFIAIDTELTGKNTVSLVFKEEEGGFLAGALAAMTSKTGIVGFIGGKADDAQELAYQAGYYQGVRYINQKFDKAVRIKSQFVGYFEKDITPERAKSITVQQYTYGVDIIFQAAGNAAEGVFQGASEKGGLVIGSDVNQNWKLPGLMPASIVKNFDTVLRTVVNQYAAGKRYQGILLYSLKNNGIRITDMRNVEFAEKFGVKQKQHYIDKIMEAKNSVSDETVAELQEIRAQITQGQIKVSDLLSEDYKKSLETTGNPTTSKDKH